MSARQTGEAEEDDGGTRRRWLLRRDQRCLRVRLNLADLGEPLFAAIDATRRGGDEHGGARPRHGRLRRGQGISTLMADSTSFSRVHRIQRKGKKGMEGARAARPRVCSAAAVMATRWSRARGESYLRRKMEWRWGRGRGETHKGAMVQRNRTMALGFGWDLLGGARCSRRATASRGAKK